MYNCPDVVFMDDDARPVRAGSIVEDFPEEENIRHKELPACSLDINLIEHARNPLGSRTADHQPP